MEKAPRDPSDFSFTVKMITNPLYAIDDYFVQERGETFSESKSRRRLLVAVKSPGYEIESKNAAKWKHFLQFIYVF